MKLSELAKAFHKEHTCDKTTDYDAAADFLKGRGVKPWIKDSKNRSLVARLVHYYENNDELSSDIDWEDDD